MIDPITAIAGATKAFTLVKAMVEVGKSAEDTMMQIGVWYGHASDVLYADKKAKDISPFRRVVFRKSAQQEAIQAFAAKKKLESQQRELISMINLVYGAQGLQEFREIRKQIVQEREDTVYRQQEMKEAMVSSFSIMVLVAVLSGLLMFMFS
jgi:alpha-acetolactate decarboxylase